MPKVVITAAKGLHQVPGSATMLGQRSHIISLDNVNQDIKIEAQKRLNRDLSE